MLHTPGDHPVTLTVEGREYASVLRVVDTVPPKASAQTILREPDELIEPEDFLAFTEDETALTASYVNAPDPKSRAFQEIQIRVTDAGGNHTDVTAGLLLTHATPVEIEARTAPLTPAECLAGTEYTDAVLVKEFIPSETGTFAVTLQVDGTPELAIVAVHDTTPPVLTAGTVSGYLAHPLEAKDVCTVSDVSPVEVRYIDPVDWDLLGEQTVGIAATDASGNEARASVVLRLRADTEPPVLYGVKTRYFYLDDPISYLTGVAARDAADGELPIAVDTSEVDTTRAGSYFVRYTATDAAGNTASARALIVLQNSKVSTEKLDRYVQRIIRDIFTDDMTLGDKVFAIYDYVYTHVRYSARSDKTDWRREALRAIQKGKGDCFTSNSLARALLEQTDAEVISMQRTGYNTHHYWLLVNVGTGWYHFDATNSREHHYKCCMWTDRQCSVKGAFWRYEKSICPEVATERFDRAAAAAVEADWVAQHRADNGDD